MVLELLVVIFQLLERVQGEIREESGGRECSERDSWLLVLQAKRLRTKALRGKRVLRGRRGKRQSTKGAFKSRHPLCHSAPQAPLPLRPLRPLCPSGLSLIVYAWSTLNTNNFLSQSKKRATRRPLFDYCFSKLPFLDVFVQLVVKVSNKSEDNWIVKLLLLLLLLYALIVNCTSPLLGYDSTLNV